jgi:coenzyme F420-reducing hydrogenase gamma subunit
MKECIKCKVVKPLDDFRKKRGACKACERLYNQKYHKDNSELVSERKKEYWVKNRESLIVNKRNRLYNLDEDWYENKLVEQDFRCLGCLTHQKDLEYALCVDHCHTTDKPRGLLCRPCNLALGNCNDNEDTLRRLAKYAEETRKANEGIHGD